MADSFDTQVGNLNRQRQMAEMLFQQGMTPMQGQMVSGHYVSPGIAGGLLKALQIYQGGKGLEQSDQKLTNLVKQREQQQQDWLGGMPMSTGNSSDAGPVVPTTPSPEQYMAWALKGQQFNPQAAQIGAQFANLAAGREDRANARQEAAQTRKEMLEIQNQNAQEQAKLRASLQPEPLQPVLGPNGQPVLMPRSQAVGMAPWNPAAAKTQSQIEEKEKGKQTVSDVVSDLGKYYDKLKQEGGITTTGGNPLTNLSARLANTSAGQALASIGGTEAQQARESISQTRPLLMTAIKNATGMSSQQLNSNAELQFYLQSATDPSKGYEANMEALQRLDKMFGLGLLGAESAPTGSAPTQAKPTGAPKRIKFDAQGNVIQ